MGHARIRRVPTQIKCKLRAARARTTCKYFRNPWCQLAFNGNVLALTANEITPPLTARLRPKADVGQDSSLACVNYKPALPYAN